MAEPEQMPSRKQIPYCQKFPTTLKSTDSFPETCSIPTHIWIQMHTHKLCTSYRCYNYSYLLYSMEETKECLSVMCVYVSLQFSWVAFQMYSTVYIPLLYETDILQLQYEDDQISCHTTRCVGIPIILVYELIMKFDYWTEHSVCVAV